MAIANSGWKKPNPKPTTCEAKATDKHSVVVAFVNFDDVVTSSSSSFPRRNAQTTCLLPFSVVVFLLFAAKEVKRTDSDDDAKKTMILLCFVCIYVRLRECNVRRFYEAKSFIFPPEKKLERVAKG
jgi:hypothetical protein|tara:strand:+ start:232 stop:609 length:378 start_codon:yes stop_codon:yes gene_type:complete